MKKKETIRSLWTPTAGMLTGARRVAMLLLTTLLLTMTAQTAWAQDVISINYELYGGTNSPNNPENYNSEAGVSSLSDPIPPENSGYTFGGWYRDPEFLTPVSDTAIPSGSTEDFYFYAKWLKSITGNVIWVDNNDLDGNRPTSVEVYLLANEKQIEKITVSGENEWEYTFENMPVHHSGEKIIYTISVPDNMPDLYDCSIEGTQITFTRKKGNLTVTNTVTNSLEYLNDKEFTFTVTLEPEISGTFGEMIFNNGVATFQLTNGQSFTAADLPTSLDYTVTVASKKGFSSDKLEINGLISTDPSIAEFNHTYSAEGSVMLEAKANVKNPYLQAKSFFFKLLDAYNNVIQQNAEQNNETGEATFAPINYTLADLEGNQSKEFDYTIEQVIPEGAETINGWPTKDGVAYENESKPVTVTVTDNGDGKLVVSDFTIPIWNNKVVATVTADDLSKVYGENDPELTAKVKVGEEEISEEIDYSLSRKEGDDVGNYDITPVVVDPIQGDYTIICNPGTLTVNPKAVTITADDDSKTYDGTPLTKNTFTTSPLESGDTHIFNVEMTQESTITNVGIQPNVIAKVDGVDVNTGEIIAVGNYLVTTVDGALTINPLEGVIVTITEHSDNPVYTGEMQTVTGYDVDISNTLYTKDDFTFSGTATASGTDAGTYPMELKPENFTNTNQNFSNVSFNITDGALTINPITETVTVNITGNSDNPVYDGSEHTVEGYDVDISNTLYTKDDFTFSGTATASGTDAGTYPMELKPENFTNTNPNFSNVTFNVTDGALTISPISETVTVTITEHSNIDEIVYNGSEHTVTGYDVAIDNELYTEADFTFSGNAEVKGTNAGTYPMELKPEDFTNTNQNFSNVTFIITDGKLTISKAPLTVTAKDHIIFYGNAAANNGVEYSGFVNDETENDLGGELTYTYSKNNGAYSEDIDTPGDYVITPRGLTSDNYDITFVSGTLTVNPVTVKVRVVDKGNGEPIVGLHVFVRIKSNTETNGKIIHEWNSTTEDHIIEGIKAGEEYSIEGLEFNGYTHSAEYTLTIDENGNVSYSGTIIENDVLLVENSQTKVEISVVDMVDGDKLEGATVQVIDSEGKIVEEWVSGMENHIIEGLAIFEEYTLCETVAPDGYAAPAAYTFKIDIDGKVTTTDGTTTTDEEGNTVLVLENPFTVPLFAANSSNLWMTWCDKYDYEKPEGVTVYTVSGVENNTVTLEKVSVIPAYTPVLLYREAADDDAVTATFSAVGTAPASGYDNSSGIVEANISDNVTLYGNSGDGAYDSGSDNNIFAVSESSAIQSYVLLDGQFVLVDYDQGISAHRCWLNVTKSTTNGARLLSIDTDSESTGIETTNFMNSANSSGAWYGIDGRKLDGKPTKKGLYIYNGKKQVIK